jgi:hypothetical protein
MTTLLSALAFTLLGLSSADIVPDGDYEIRITTPTEGVVVDDLSGWGHAVVLAGPYVSIEVDEEVVLSVKALDKPSVSAVFNQKNEWVTWEGSFEVEVVRDDEVEGRFLVRDATMVLGRFEGSEGWAD